MIAFFVLAVLLYLVWKVCGLQLFIILTIVGIAMVILDAVMQRKKK